MKDITKLKDYRRKFKRYYGIDYSNDYVIHHIDLNHNNNNINNLMLLPKTLHQQYHFYLNATHWYKEDLYTRKIDIKIKGNGVCNDNYNMQMLKDLIGVLEECNKWYDYKLYLDGLLPNIHNIEVQ